MITELKYGDFYLKKEGIYFSDNYGTTVYLGILSDVKNQIEKLEEELNLLRAISLADDSFGDEGLEV